MRSASNSRKRQRNDQNPETGLQSFSGVLCIFADSTAGLYWSSYSWPYFAPILGRPFFAWRASWGQRLVIDLEKALVLSETQQSAAPIATALNEAEKRGVHKFLFTMSKRIAEVRERLQKKEEFEIQHPLDEGIGCAASALHLAGVHQIRACIPFLRQWEDIDFPRISMGTVTNRDWWLEIQHFRPIVHHSLRLLNEEPAGYAPFHFCFLDKNRFSVPERLTDRFERKEKLAQGMSVQQVLLLLGSPDHIKRRSRKEGKIYKWYEGWEYDFLDDDGWMTLRITWKEVERKGRIIAIKEVPAYWLNSDERQAEILRDFL